MIRAASVENDEDEERLLEEQLARYGRDRNVETSCVHYQSAEAFLDAPYDVDVVFMDIDLPGMNGMDAAAQMCAGGEDDSRRFEDKLKARFYAFEAVVLDPQLLDLILKNAQIGAAGQLAQIVIVIVVKVALRAQRADGRAFGGVEPPHHHRRSVGRARLHAAEGGDFAHEGALGGAADGRIARHVGSVIDVLHDHQRFRAHLRGSERRLAAGMAAADDDHVKAAFGKDLHCGHRPICGPSPRS